MNKFKYFRLVFVVVGFFIFFSKLQSQGWIISNNISGNDIEPVLSVLDENKNTYIISNFVDTFYTNTAFFISRGNKDLSVSKINSVGVTSWHRQIGSTGLDISGGIAIDPHGNLYVSGTFSGTCFFSPEDSLVSIDSYDFFLAKYQSDGSFLWAKSIGTGSNIQSTNDIKIDADGNIILSGFFKGELAIGNPEAPLNNLTGDGTTVFIAKLNPEGNHIWSYDIPISYDFSRINRVSISGDGYYFGGLFQGSIILNEETINSVAANFDIVLFKVTKGGAFEWIRKITGSGTENFKSITTDEFNNLYVLGNYTSNSLTVDSTETETKIVSGNLGGYDTFIGKYNRSGILQWFVQKGGTAKDIYNNFIVRNKIIYTTGYFADQIVFNLDTLRTSTPTNEDAFLAAFNSIGDPLSGISVKGVGEYNDGAVSVRMDNDNQAYVTGYFRSEQVTMGDSVFIHDHPGKRDVFFGVYNHPYKAAITAEQQVDCNGNSTGMLTATPYFGVPPYTYSWSHDAGLNDSVATDLSAGIYTVTVTDSRDSIAQAVGTITQPNPLSILFTPTSPSCFNGADGAIDLTVTGGKKNYAYQWSGGAGVDPSAEDQSGITAGWFYLDVFDANGCTASDSIEISQPGEIMFSGSIVTPSDSVQAKNGSIDLAVAGGTPGYNFDWTGPNAFSAGTEDLDTLNGGEYTVLVTDINGCTNDTSFLVFEGSNFIPFIASHRNVTCNGAANGSATAGVYGGIGPFAYMWRNAQGEVLGSEETIEGLSGGWLYLEVIDNNDGDPINGFDSVQIVEAATPLSMIKFVSQPKCFGSKDGYINYNFAGGVKPYTYKWADGPVTEDRSGLAASTQYYRITVTDQYGCTFKDSTLLTQPSMLGISVFNNQPVECKGTLSGELTAIVVGGTKPYAYLWNDPGNQVTPIAEGLGAGVYTVKVTDKNGCKGQKQTILADAKILQFANTLVQQITCNNGNDGQIEVTTNKPQNDISFIWSHTPVDNPVMESLGAGEYTVIAFDTDCNEYDTATIALPNPDALTIDSVKTQDVSCFGATDGAINIYTSGGSGNLLSELLNPLNDSVFTISNLPAGDYSYGIIDNTCEDTASTNLTITQPEELSLSLEKTDATNQSSNDGQITANASGGTTPYEYAINSGFFQTENVFNGLGPGQYTVELDDANGCGRVEETVSLVTGINDVFDPANISVYPNPSKGKFQLRINGDILSATSLKILSATGKTVWEGQIDTQSYKGGYHIVQVDLTGFAAGNYFLKVQDVKYSLPIILR